MTDRQVWGPAPATQGKQIALVLGPEDLGRAVRSLAAHPDARHLDVRAGEHLAGIVLTAFNGLPASVDTDGGLDFVFHRPARPRSWQLGHSSVAAVEVKSSPGTFRHKESKMAVGAELTIPVTTAAELLAGCTDVVLRAVDALDRKARPGWSRHVFLILHPFDGIAAESLDNEAGFLADRLPPIDHGLGLDSLWVLFHSMSVTLRWSAAESRWSNMVFALWGPDDGPEPPGLLRDLAEAESLLLELLDHAQGSPWMFDVTQAEPDKP